MSTHNVHDEHGHTHGSNCGHAAIQHEGHKDYLHEGHLHHVHEGHVDEHVLPVSTSNPAHCTPQHACAGHEASHQHADTCGHEKVPHGNHTDYLVDGHLHHGHGSHCDDHGQVVKG